MSEYYAKMASGAPCSYSNLHNYNGQPMVPLPEMVPSMSTQVVYSHQPMSYDTLSHGQGCNCGGHFDINGAYPHAQGGCPNMYVKRHCA